MGNSPLSYVVGAMLLIEAILTVTAIIGLLVNPLLAGRRRATREACVGVCCLFAMTLASLKA